MSLLERYIFRRAFTFSLGALGSLVLIVWIVQALQRVDIVRSSASAAGNMLWIAMMLIPDLAAGVIPFAVVIGAIQALNSLNADSERAVIAASGARSSVVIKPILALGVVGAFLILLISHIVGPIAQGAFYNGLRAVNADAITLFLTPGRFEEVQDGLVVSVGDVRGSTIYNLFMSDHRDPTMDLNYFAKEAQLLDRDGQSYLLLRDGQVHRRKVDDGTISVIQFQTYAFDLASLRPESDGDWIRTSERSTAELFGTDASDNGMQNRPAAFAKELTQRFTDWLYPIAFALWALVVAGRPRTNRQASSSAMTLGLSGALGLKALGFVGLALIDRDTSYQFVSYLLPLLSIASSAVLLWADVDITQARIFVRTGDAFRAIGRLFQRGEAAGLGSGGRAG